MPNTTTNKTFAQIYDKTLGRLVTRMIRRAVPTTHDPQVIMAPLSVGTDEIGEAGDIIHTGDLRTAGNHTVDGDLDIGKHASLRGDVDINGIVTIGKRATIFGPLLVNSSAALGYSTGAGGTVTQATSRITAVTLNKPVGQVTLFTTSGVAAWQTFTINNIFVEAKDTVAISYTGATNSYLMFPDRVDNGSFRVWFYSISGVAIDTPRVNFAVIKGATS